MKEEQFYDSELIINRLIEKTNSDENFAKLLSCSLKLAREKAKEKLKLDLFDALTWPNDLDEYFNYLSSFSKWIPQENIDLCWESPENDGQQEVFDRLNHFYWLINQNVELDESKIFQNTPWFSDWLVTYNKSLGSFLNTTKSFSQESLESFLKFAPKYRVQDSMIDGKANNPSGWLTFNQFFARELNPGLRPISSPTDNFSISSPADCTFRAIYQIDDQSQIPEITIKKTHKYAKIQNLLENSKFKNDFVNGTFVHYFLAPSSYHRFHLPVSGKVVESYTINGLVHLDVNIKENQFDAPDNSQGGYQFAQSRGVLTIDTTHSIYGNVGIIAVIPIGMAHVSSVNMIATVGSEMLKGDEFGYFLFGGSDIIVLFQENVKPIIDTKDHYRLYGSEIARSKKS